MYVDSCIETVQELDLVRHLGAGAYNNVYKLSEPRSYLKLPMRCSIVDSLQNELPGAQSIGSRQYPESS